MLYPNNYAVKNSIASQCDHYYAGYPQDKIHSLVMVSGGLDSVALLASMLQHTKHKVHAHFVEIINKEQRNKVEKAAVEKCVHYLLRNYRPFEFTTSAYEMMLGEPKWVGPDVSVVMFMASRLNKAIGNTIDMVWTGHLRVPTFEYIDAGAVFAASYTNVLKKPLWMLPLQNFLKYDVYQSIPKELAELTWSCRSPVYDSQGNATRCGQCHACGAMLRIKILSESRQEVKAAAAPTLEQADPGMSFEAASQQWPCLYPRYDGARHIMRCGVCSNCHTLVEFEHKKRQQPTKASEIN